MALQEVSGGGGWDLIVHLARPQFLDQKNRKKPEGFVQARSETQYSH